MHPDINLILHTLTSLPHLASAGSTIVDSAGQACGNSCNKVDLKTIFASLTNTLIYLVGAISVVMVMIGGLRYVLSNGDPKGAESARNTILYAVIGIGISIAAYSIVKFVATSIH